MALLSVLAGMGPSLVPDKNVKQVSSPLSKHHPVCFRGSRYQSRRTIISPALVSELSDSTCHLLHRLHCAFVIFGSEVDVYEAQACN